MEAVPSDQFLGGELTALLAASSQQGNDDALADYLSANVKAEDLIAADAAALQLKRGRRMEREAAAKALGTLGAAAIPHAAVLAYAMADEAEEVQAAAMSSVQGLVPVFLQEILVCMLAAADISSPMAAALVDILGSPFPKVREAAVTCLWAMGEAALFQLTDALRDKNPKRQLFAAQLITRLHFVATARTESAVQTVTAALSDSDAAVRRAALEAVWTLAQEAEAATGEVAARLLDDREALEVRCAAAAAIGALGPAAARYRQQAWEMTAYCLRSVHVQVRVMAARAAALLHKSSETSAVRGEAGCGDAAGNVAMAALWDDDPQVRMAAADAIGALHTEAFGPRLRFAVEAVGARLQDDVPMVCCLAAAALGELGSAAVIYHEAACEVAVSHLKNEDAEVRVYAAIAIGSLGEVAAPYAMEAGRIVAREFGQSHLVLCVLARAVKALKLAAVAYVEGATRHAAEALASKDIFQRLRGCAALGTLDHARGAGASRLACHQAAEQLRSSDWNARLGGAQVLVAAGRYGIAHIEALFRALRDSRAEVRNTAGTALVGMGRAGLGYLAIAMKDVDWKAREAAAHALEDAGYEALPYVPINAMRDD
eukprot:TRINITY_DN32090_c0_g1_i1.p1 TRINITY_DN32090_c0_g1~~TRINITY_DN32090_c0_g1_i1.p1  ORF type:complete len:622 (-),score=174.59 TRINITY_DN32090_c0_g1_i1:66-1871(-)